MWKHLQLCTKRIKTFFFKSYEQRPFHRNHLRNKIRYFEVVKSAWCTKQKVFCVFNSNVRLTNNDSTATHRYSLKIIKMDFFYNYPVSATLQQNFKKQSSPGPNLIIRKDLKFCT